METRLGAWEEEEEEVEERTTRHILVVAASTPPALGPGLMSSAANHFAGGPEAGGTRFLSFWPWSVNFHFFGPERLVYDKRTLLAPDAGELESPDGL